MQRTCVHEFSTQVPFLEPLLSITNNDDNHDGHKITMLLNAMCVIYFQ